MESGKKKKQEKRRPSDIAADLEKTLVLKVTELLNSSVQNYAHWLILEECTEWVQQQCTAAPGELENEALTAVLSGIHSWLEKSRHSGGKEKIANEYRSAMRDELGALRFRNSQKNLSSSGRDMQLCFHPACFATAPSSYKQVAES